MPAYNKHILPDWFYAALQTSRKCGRSASRGRMEHKYVIQVGKQLYGINYPDNDHLLFAYMGHTLAEIQSFEAMLCFTLSAIMKDSKAKVDFEESMQKNATKTLGAVLNH